MLKLTMSAFKLPPNIAGIGTGLFLALGALALVVGSVLGFAYQPVMHRLLPHQPAVATLSPQPQVPSWATLEAAVTTLEGTQYVTQLKITHAAAMSKQPDVTITGDLASVATVDVKNTVVDGNTATVNMSVALPAVAKDAYAGSIQLLYDGKPVGAPLGVSVHTLRADCQSIPSQLSQPSPDRIVTLAGASVVEDMMTVTFKDSVSDKNAAIREIACKYGAQIVGSAGGTSTYELRIPGQKPVTLSPLVDKVKKEAGVSTAVISPAPSSP